MMQIKNAAEGAKEVAQQVEIFPTCWMIRSQISVAQCSLEVRRQEGRGEKEGETFKYIGSKSVYLQIMIASHCSNLFVPAVCEGTPDILRVAARYDTTRLKITQYTMPWWLIKWVRQLILLCCAVLWSDVLCCDGELCWVGAWQTCISIPLLDYITTLLVTFTHAFLCTINRN